MWRRIPDVLPAMVVAVTGIVDLLGSSDGHMKPQFGGLDEQGRLIDYDTRFMIDTRFMVDGRGRGGGDDDGLRPAPDIDSETEIEGRGKDMVDGEGGDNRQAEQNFFHKVAPSLV